MKKGIAFAFCAAVIAAIGCTSMSPKNKYTADQPPPIIKNSDGRTELPATRLSDNRKHVSPDQIDETNYEDSFARLDNDIQSDKRAMTKLGK